MYAWHSITTQQITLQVPFLFIQFTTILFRFFLAYIVFALIWHNFRAFGRLSQNLPIFTMQRKREYRRTHCKQSFTISINIITVILLCILFYWSIVWPNSPAIYNGNEKETNKTQTFLSCLSEPHTADRIEYTPLASEFYNIYYDLWWWAHFI